MEDRKQRLLLHYDDSSDEEGSDDDNEYGHAVNKFSSQIKFDPILGSQIQDLTASFNIYYHGLLLYHVPAVRASYKKSKELHLAQSVIPTEEKLVDWIRAAIRKAIFSELLLPSHPRASKKLIALCVDSVEQEISGFVDICMVALRKTIRASFYGKPLPVAIKESFEKLSLAISEFLSDNKNYVGLNQADFKPPKHVSSENLFAIEGIRERITAEYEEEMDEIEEVHGWVKKDGFTAANSLLSPTKKIRSADSMRKVCDTILDGFDLRPVQKSYIKKIKTIEAPVQPRIFANNFKALFLKKKLKLLIDEENSKEDSILLQDQIIEDADLSASEFSTFEEYMEDFMPCTAEKFQEMLEEQDMNAVILEEFLSILKKSSEKLQGDISRGTLPTVCVHEIHDCVEYIASLKLTNRSVVRTYRNQSQVSILGNDKEENHDYGWKFPASEIYIAIERNRITGNSRTALMPIQTMSNAYNDIVVKIKAIKTNLQVSDQVIGLWIRQVLQCKALNFNVVLSVRNREDLTMFIIQIAHLLGGIECMRYPGAMIQNQMALDLIIGGVLKWKKVLDPTNTDTPYLPMTMGKATNVVRALIITYREFTKFDHHYPGKEVSIESDEFKSFISAERKLSDQWFRFYKKSTSGPKENQLSEAIKEAIPEWYPGLA